MTFHGNERCERFCGRSNSTNGNKRLRDRLVVKREFLFYRFASKLITILSVHNFVSPLITTNCHRLYVSHARQVRALADIRPSFCVVLFKVAILLKRMIAIRFLHFLLLSCLRAPLFVLINCFLAFCCIIAKINLLQSIEIFYSSNKTETLLRMSFF